MRSSSRTASVLYPTTAPARATFADFGAEAGGAPAAPAHPAAVSWADAERMVQDALARGAQAAEAALNAQLEQAIGQAYAQGREAGLAEGEIAERARLRHAVGAAEDALEEIRANEAQWTGVVEENVCALATAIARQLIGRELRLDAEAVAALVRAALREVPIDQPVAIRVNPQDLALLAGARAEDATPADVAQGRDARWVADAKIAPGGCMIEGRERVVDGRIDTALERLYRRLTYNNA